ncbi:hypothetical protein LLG96_03500 [bacterium]|nr:hypothetical protein [bacterium]
MPDSYIYKSFEISGNGAAVSARIAGLLSESGYIRTGDDNAVQFFRYPSLRFSSKKPLTCVSRLSLAYGDKNGASAIKIGVTFTKIRYFTIAFILIICGIIPALISMAQKGVPEIPPTAYLGIPLGFMVHYHVRWRIFRILRQLVQTAEGDRR